ncbi:MAG TPA: protein-glutamate O-methyltransferase CheR [Polyangiaceae bacterium]|nr:protein-glutamate O-methyltransferase CheR [Polyangiaceae bacterium]
MSSNEIETIELRLVLEAIHAKYGYDFREYQSATIRRRLQAALARSGASHFGELQHRLLHEPEFFHSIIDELTVQVSEMFRDPSFYRAFREQVIPLLRTYPQLKIWHAGCASGEEVYTTAILLAEENLYDRTQIYATDVSATALEHAREGMYPDSQIESFSDNYEKSGGKRSFAEYYSAAYGRMALRAGLRRNMVFFQHDLVSDYALGEMHVIFCRNVLIYFGPALRERVLAMFGKGLCRGGFLCLGGSESLPAKSQAMFSEFLAPERIYRCQGAS